MRHLHWKRVLASLVLLACAACSNAARPPQRPLAETDYPGTLRSSEQLPDGLFFRQRVQVEHGAHSGSFNAVIESADGRLRMLTTTPFGTRAFLIEQRGTAVNMVAYVEQKLPFPPRFMILDLQRTFFLGSGEPPLSHGERSSIRDGEEMIERFENGALVARRFRRLDARPAGWIEIEYKGGMRGLEPPPTIVLRNGWFGYTLTITTLPAG